MNETKVTTLRLSEELAAEIAAVARVDGTSLTDAIRKAVAKHIAARRTDPDFQKRLKERMEEGRAILERLAE